MVQIIIVNSYRLVQINFPENIFTVHKQPLDNSSLGKTNLKHCQI